MSLSSVSRILLSIGYFFCSTWVHDRVFLVYVTVFTVSWKCTFLIPVLVQHVLQRPNLYNGSPQTTVPSNTLSEMLAADIPLFAWPIPLLQSPPIWWLCALWSAQEGQLHFFFKRVTSRLRWTWSDLRWPPYLTLPSTWPGPPCTDYSRCLRSSVPKCRVCEAWGSETWRFESRLLTLLALWSSARHLTPLHLNRKVGNNEKNDLTGLLKAPGTQCLAHTDW